MTHFAGFKKREKRGGRAKQKKNNRRQDKWFAQVALVLSRLYYSRAIPCRSHPRVTRLLYFVATNRARLSPCDLRPADQFSSPSRFHLFRLASFSSDSQRKFPPENKATLWVKPFYSQMNKSALEIWIFYGRILLYCASQFFQVKCKRHANDFHVNVNVLVELNSFNYHRYFIN